MKKIILVLGLFLSFNLLAADIDVIDAQIKPTLPGSEVTAIFAKIKNNSSKDVKLVKVTSDFSEVMELHTMEMNGGKMVMRPVDSILLKSKSTTELKSGGLHIMVFKLKNPIAEGKSLNAKLILDNKKEISFSMKAHSEDSSAHSHH